MNEDFSVKNIILNISLIILSSFVCFWVGFTSWDDNAFLNLTYKPLEHCQMEGNDLKCYLDPCEENCNQTYSWKKYEKENQIIFISTKPQFTKRLDKIKSFCNQRSRYCSIIYGWYEDNKIQLESETTEQIVKNIFHSILFSMPSVKKFVNNFCQLRNKKKTD